MTGFENARSSIRRSFILIVRIFGFSFRKGTGHESQVSFEQHRYR